MSDIYNIFEHENTDYDDVIERASNTITEFSFLQGNKEMGQMSFTFAIASIKKKNAGAKFVLRFNGFRPSDNTVIVDNERLVRPESFSVTIL